MKWKITLLLFLWLQFSFAQYLSQRLFDKNDGLKEAKVNGMFMTYDSLFYVINGNFTFSTWDGYGIRELSTNVNFKFSFPLFLKNYTQSSIVGSYEDEIFYFYKNEKTHLLDFEDRPLLKKHFHTLRPYEKADGIYICDPDLNIYKLNEQDFTFDYDSKAKISIENPIDTVHFFYNETFDGQYARYQFSENQPNCIQTNGLQKLKENEVSNIFGGLCKEEDLGIFENYIHDGNSWSTLGHRVKKRHHVFDYKSYYSHTREDKILSVQKIDEDCQKEEIGQSKIQSSGFIHGDSLRLIYYSMNGIFKLNPSAVHFDKSHPGMVSTVSAIGEDINGKIWLGSYGDGMCTWDGNQIKKVQNDSISKIVTGGFTYNGKLYFSRELPNNTIEITDKIQTYSSLGAEDEYIPYYFMDTLSNGKLVIGSCRKGIMIDTSTTDRLEFKYINKEKGLGIDNAYSVAEDKLGRLWTCNGGGFCIYDAKNDTSFNFLNRDSDKIGLSGMAIERDDLDNFWIGSYNGIYLIEQPHTFDPLEHESKPKISYIEFPNGDRSTTKFMKQIDDYIVCGNNTAISFIPILDYYKDPKTCPIYQMYFGEDIEANGSCINSVFFDSKRNLWIGHLNGATMIKWDNLVFDKTKNKIRPLGLKIGNQSFDTIKNNTITLPKDMRNFKLDVGLVKNYSLLKNVFYRYILTNGNDTIMDRKFDQTGSLDLPYLSAGKYDLLIRASKHGQPMDQLKMRIKAPLALSENKFFWLGLGSLGFLLLSLFIWYRNNQKRKLLEKELLLENLNREKENLRVGATLNSFNPHFINNSLHWIQSKYYQDNDMVKIINGLSENIRYIFENTRSQNVTHSIQNELDIVRNYVDIQQIRFDHAFEYRFSSELSDPKMNQQIILMQIQIHIENAIEHGLRNKEDSSYVSLVITENEDEIVYTIEDDGAGRTKAKEIGSRGTQAGTQMLNELQNIYNKRTNQKIVTTYEDNIFIENGQSFGTRVQISYPKNFTLKIQ